MPRRSLIIFLIITVPLGIVLSFWFRPLPVSSVRESINRGLGFLNHLPSASSYPDAYLSFVYPDEQLNCPIAGCVVTYRLMDAWFDVLAIARQYPDARKSMATQVTHAEAVLTSLLPEWRTANLKNTVRSNGPGGVALDTACILGYTLHDEELAGHVLFFLDPNEDWLRSDYYSTDTWRNIADETWCIRLLAQFPQSAHPVEALVQRKIDETEHFLAQEKDPFSRFAVLYHMSALLAEVHLSQYATQAETYTAMLHEAAKDERLTADVFTSANILDALVGAGEARSADASTLARTLLQQQEANGSWTRENLAESYPVFTTLRVLDALTSFWQSQR